MPTRFELRASPVSLCEGDCRLGGGVRFVRCARLAGNASFFGGLSSLAHLGGDGLLAVSDRGWAVRLPDWPPETSTATAEPLADEFGVPLAGRHLPAGSAADATRITDAEGIAVATPDAVFISFERVQMVRRYTALPAGRGAAPLVGAPLLHARLSALCGAGNNLGTEALASLNATHLLAVCEARAGDASTSALVAELAGGGEVRRVWQLRVALRGSPFRVADAALLPSRGGAGAAAVGREDLLLLLARYEPGVGNTLRVARVRRRELERAAAGTLLEPLRLAGRGGGEESAGVGEVEPEEVFTLSPRLHATENFEGLAAVASSDGVRLLLLSDNDYRRRTILLELLWPWPLRAAGETAAATPRSAEGGAPMIVEPRAPTDLPLTGFVGAASAALLVAAVWLLRRGRRIKQGATPTGLV